MPPKSYKPTDLKTSRHSKLLLEPLSEQKVKGSKSFSIRTAKAKNLTRSKQKILNELKIDSKCEGTHLRMKNYRKWFND